MFTKSEEKALDRYPDGKVYYSAQLCFQQGYEQAEIDILSIIQSRLSEIIGDAQPKPILRAELQELIDKIKEQ